MSKMIFIKEIISIEKEPRLCPTCQKEDRLEKDLMIREGRSDGRNNPMFTMRSTDCNNY